jgi:epoxide hydrolase A/B
MPSSRTISANGIDLFVVEQGQGPLVVLCHGWPELSYSWRHQIPAIAEAGFHVVAPDMRGFGRTSAPAEIGAYTIFDNVGDMVALVEALGEKQAVIIGHDWGAPVAWHAAMFRPDIFTKVAGLSVPPPFRGRSLPLEALRKNGITISTGSIFRPPAKPRPNSSAMSLPRCESCWPDADHPIRRPISISRRARASSPALPRIGHSRTG